MKKFLIAATMATLLVGGLSNAYAEEQDIAQIKCSEFIQDKDHMGMVLMWLDGYASQKSDNTVISDEWLEKLGLHMAKFCSENPDTGILDAMGAMEE